MLLAFLLSLCSEADALYRIFPSLKFRLGTSSGLSRHWPNAGYQKYSHDEKLLESTIYQSLHYDCDTRCISIFSLDWSHPMIRFLVLAGYFELTIYLHLSGKLNQYINMHYSYLAYISMVLSFILAIVQLYIWMKQVKTPSHLNIRLAKGTSIALLAIPIVVGLTFPTVSLDSQTVSAKGYHFPLSEGTDQAIQTSEGTTSQYLKPDTSSYFFKISLWKGNANGSR